MSDGTNALGRACLRVASLFGPVYPLLAVVLIYGNWLVACMALGRTPRPMQDDPKHIDAVNAVVHWLSVFGVVIGFWLFWIALLVLLIGLVVPTQSRRKQLALRLLLSSLGIAALYGLVRADPGAVVLWYLD